MVVLTSPTTSTAPSPPPVGTYIDNGSLQLVEILGYGGYGIVYRAIPTAPTPPGQQPISYAVKCLPHLTKRSSSSSAANTLAAASRQRQLHMRETTLHSLVSSHPNIITLHRVVTDNITQHTFIILDFAPSSDLFTQILHNRTYLGNDELIKDVFLQMVGAVEYSHKMGVYHRDLKPENVLCFDDGKRVAITDFGLATTERWSREFRTGSVYHMSPECQGPPANSSPSQTPSYSPPASDIWSLGIILLNLITGRNPWKSAAITDPTFLAYLAQPSRFLPSVLPISDECNEILSDVGGLLDLDGNRRGFVGFSASSTHSSLKSRVGWDILRAKIRAVKTFYAHDVVFESGMARCKWEVESPGDHLDDEDSVESEGYLGPVRSMVGEVVHSVQHTINEGANHSVIPEVQEAWPATSEGAEAQEWDYDVESQLRRRRERINESRWSEGSSVTRSAGEVASSVVFSRPHHQQGQQAYQYECNFTSTPSWTPTPLSSSPTNYVVYSNTLSPSSSVTRSRSQNQSPSFIHYSLTRSTRGRSPVFTRRNLGTFDTPSVSSTSSEYTDTEESGSSEEEEGQTPSPPITPPGHQGFTFPRTQGNRDRRLLLAPLDTSVGVFNHRNSPRRSALPRRTPISARSIVSSARAETLVSARDRDREVLVSSAVIGMDVQWDEEMMMMRTALEMESYSAIESANPASELCWSAAAEAVKGPLRPKGQGDTRNFFDLSEDDGEGEEVPVIDESFSKGTEKPSEKDMEELKEEEDVRMSIVVTSAQEEPAHDNGDEMEFSYTYSEYTYSYTQIVSALEPESAKEEKDENRMSIVFTSPTSPPFPTATRPESPVLGLDFGTTPIPIPPPTNVPIISSDSHWTAITSTSTTRAVVDYIPTSNQNVFGYGDAFSFLNYAPSNPPTGPMHHQGNVQDSPYSIPPSAPSFSFSTYQSSHASYITPNVETGGAFIPGCGGFGGFGVGFVRSGAPPPSSTYSIPNTSTTPVMSTPAMPDPSDCGGSYAFLDSIAPSPAPRPMPMPRSILDSPPPLPIRPPPSPTTRAALSHSREGRSRTRSRFTQSRSGNRSRMQVSVKDSIRGRNRRERSATTSRTTSLSFLSSMLTFPKRSNEGETHPPVVPSAKDNGKIGTGCGPGAMPPPPTPASATPSISSVLPRAQGEKLKTHWTLSTSISHPKEDILRRGEGLRRRRKSPLGWFSPGKLFAAVLPSSST